MLAMHGRQATPCKAVAQRSNHRHAHRCFVPSTPSMLTKQPTQLVSIFLLCLALGLPFLAIQQLALLSCNATIQGLACTSVFLPLVSHDILVSAGYGAQVAGCRLACVVC